jgi:hypothetical protein
MSFKQREGSYEFQNLKCMETNDLLQLWTFSNGLCEPITVIIVDRVYFIAETRHLNRTAGVLRIYGSRLSSAALVFLGWPVVKG